MIIGVDARFAVRNRRGIGNYSLNLIRNLAIIDSVNQYILYIDMDDLEEVLPNQQNFFIKKLSPANYIVWEQVLLPLQAKRDNLDVLHCLGNTAPIKIARKTKLVLSIMDVMYLKDYSVLPQSYSTYQKFGRVYRKFIVPRAARNITKVITISNFSKTDILYHIKTLHSDEVAVTYLAANGIFKHCKNELTFERLKKKYNILDNFIFTLGATDLRKNTERIVRVYLYLRSNKMLSEQLVISGLPDWRDTPLYSMIQKSSLEKHIVFLDFVPEIELMCIYNFAKVFLYPSLYEGFGLPPLEAMSCGVPVITSNTTSIPEIVGNSAMLIDPYSDEAIKNALVLMLNDESLRNIYIERGYNQVKKFSWKKMASETLGIYMELQSLEMIS
ncbi:glycosyltransferase family 4 protein [Candidatus Roizmanbacteria bacterium]|nr:glycosyltransferase family 4 protein [Candidatus Roizmanbacteria bacterium]